MKRQTDVLLINPTRTGIDSYCTPPLHLMYLSKALREAGYSTQIVNIHEQYCRQTGTWANDEENLAIKDRVEREAIEELLQWEARLIGIGSICSSYAFTEQLVQRLKEAGDTPIILGGSLGLPMKELWFEHTKVDYLCECDGERLIVDLMKALDSGGDTKGIPGLCWRTAEGWEGNASDLPVDLDYISRPDLREVDYEFYMDILKRWVNRTLPSHLRLGEKDRLWPVVFSRGCIYNCAFCFHFNRKHRHHSVEHVLDYLRHLRDEFGVTVVVTWDDLVMGHPRWFMELCDALAEADLGIRIFTSGGKANMVTREMAEKMARANFIRISYGIESGSQRILDEMQKQATVEDNRRAVKVATEAGIFTHLNMVLGMPSETEHTLAETLEFLVGVVKENDLSMRNISVAFATGYPGTQLFDHMLARGIVTDVRDYILSVSGVGIADPILCDLSEEQLTSFLARLNYQVNDIHLARQGKHLRRVANRFINSACGRVAARFVPRKVKERVLGLLK